MRPLLAVCCGLAIASAAFAQRIPGHYGSIGSAFGGLFDSVAGVIVLLVLAGLGYFCLKLIVGLARLTLWALSGRRIGDIDDINDNINGSMGVVGTAFWFGLLIWGISTCSG